MSCGRLLLEIADILVYLLMDAALHRMTMLWRNFSSARGRWFKPRRGKMSQSRFKPGR
jgi:hypothetical protein